MDRCVQRIAALGLALAISPAISPVGHAAEFRSRPPHVHGLATVDIALDATTLAINFRAPAINVIGFEHAPASPDEKAAVATAAQTFGAGGRLFIAPAAAGCVQRRAELTPITYESDGEDEKPNAPEADYEMRYEFACAHPGKLDWIKTTLFDVLIHAQKITVNIVTSDLQTQVVLLPGDSRIALKP